MIDYYYKRKKMLTVMKNQKMLALNKLEFSKKQKVSS